MPSSQPVIHFPLLWKIPTYPSTHSSGTTSSVKSSLDPSFSSQAVRRGSLPSLCFIGTCTSCQPIWFCGLTGLSALLGVNWGHSCSYIQLGVQLRCFRSSPCVLFSSPGVSSSRMALSILTTQLLSSKRECQEDKPQCTNAYQASAWIMLAHIPLAKACDVSNPKVNREKLHKGMHTRRHGS